MSLSAASLPLQYRKMNGLGNEIVVVDLRGSRRACSTPSEARAIAARPGVALRPDDGAARPQDAGTEAYVRIYNTDGSEAGPAATACAASAGWCAQQTRRKPLKFETQAGVLDVAVAEQRRASPSTWASRASAGTRSRWPSRSTTRARIELQIGPIDKPILHSPSVVNVGNPHAVFWVDDVDAYDLGRFGPMLENHPIFPERANISLAARHVADVDHAAHLGARRRPDAGLRLVRPVPPAVLRRRKRLHRAAGDGDAARRPAADRMARRRSHPDDRARRARARGRDRLAGGVAELRPRGTATVGDAAPAARLSRLPRRIRVITLGCRLNAYESEVMRGHAAAAGLDDAVIVNTCAVTAEAVRQARADDPPAAARDTRRAHHRHRLRGADRARALRRHARGRSRHRQRREDAGRRRSAGLSIGDSRARRRQRHHGGARDGHVTRSTASARGPAPTCRCRTAATIAARSASSRSDAALRARCRPARSWRRSAGWSRPAMPRSC